MNRFTPIKSAFCLGLCVVFLAAFMGRCLSEDHRDLAGEISVSKSGSVSTNTYDITRHDLREDLLKERLSDRVLKPFHSGQDSLDAAMSPFMPQPERLSPGEMRRLKEHMDNSRAWAFADSDAEGYDTRMGEALDRRSDDGMERNTLTILKRQYLNDSANRSDNTNQISRNRDDSQNRAALDKVDASSRAKNESGYGGRNRNQSDGYSLKGGFDPQILRGFGVPSPNSIFLGDYEPSMGAAGQMTRRSEQQRSSDFRQLLDGGAALGGFKSTALNPLGEPPAGGQSAFGGDSGGSVGPPAGLPRMPTMPGYTPNYSSASSLSPSLAAPAAALMQTLTVQQPRMPSQFNEPSGPPRRQF